MRKGNSFNETNSGSLNPIETLGILLPPYDAPSSAVVTILDIVLLFSHR